LVRVKVTLSLSGAACAAHDKRQVAAPSDEVGCKVWLMCIVRQQNQQTVSATGVCLCSEWLYWARSVLQRRPGGPDQATRIFSSAIPAIQIVDFALSAFPLPTKLACWAVESLPWAEIIPKTRLGRRNFLQTALKVYEQ
jgi:hypothetical protein